MRNLQCRRVQQKAAGKYMGTSEHNLGFVGAGNMAEGILAALLEKGPYAREQVIVSDPATDRRELFARRFGVTATQDNRELVQKSQTILLAVKPQNFAEVAASVADLVRPDHRFISIMAGVSTRKIEQALGSEPMSADKLKHLEEGVTTSAPGSSGVRSGIRVVRVMPNLPILVGAGIAGVCAGAYATAEDVAATRAILDAGGSTIELRDESLMDAVTAVSGSGPAYFYYFVENIVAGGVACGLSPEDALKLAEFTCLGAARMMLETKEAPAELRRKVTSKGGTTQAALEHMEKAGVSDAIRDAVKAAFDRGRELGS
jgi:pyrroline-5-carboxylate reductase